MIETISLQQTKIIKIPHHFETGRLFIKYVLLTSLIRRDKQNTWSSFDTRLKAHKSYGATNQDNKNSTPFRDRQALH